MAKVPKKVSHFADIVIEDHYMVKNRTGANHAVHDDNLGASLGRIVQADGAAYVFSKSSLKKLIKTVKESK